MIRMIVKDLRINPLRTSLTALSMLIGIVALIAGVLVGTLGRDYLEAVNARLSGRTPTYSAIIDVRSLADARTTTTLQERLATFRPGTASAQYHLNDLAVWASSGVSMEIRHVTIVVTDAERMGVMPAPIIGAWLTGANEPATLETVVNESARQYVHDGTVTLARTGNPQQVPARVDGVVADGADEPVIYINAITLQRYWPQAWAPDGLTILVHPDEGVDDQHAKTALDDLLSDVGIGSVSSWNRSDNAGDYEQVIGFLQLGVIVTAILLLAVSAIGMINIGLAGIEQRSHELLIRRALGATRVNIAIQVIGSSVLLSLIIAFAAVLISMALVWAIPWMLPADSPLEPPAYPYTAAMVAADASIATSLIGSLAPAIKAIRLQPALALR
ncbi:MULTISPECIES: ABC transporter permease [Bifidobacterium]|uniref:ABC transporter permease n=1 Tax=Bifidobacterium TaxID=1678 RepID=UPI001BDD8A3F|nr:MULTISPECIES: ABC transporter permease [Bifidobacterium]MBT1162292.1 ABC transporter permease [Bifidobacterium sp. SO1]MBW3078857.1 ABC transporter permease [Bifidobacterium simiiventris]